MRVVLDTNVLVSALMTGGGTADMAVQLILQGAATLLVDSRILAEYDEVTARARFGFDEVERRAILHVLELIAEPVVARPLRVTLPDPDDRVFVGGARRAGRRDRDRQREALRSAPRITRREGAIAARVCGCDAALTVGRSLRHLIARSRRSLK